VADDKIVISIELDDGTVRKGFLNIEKAATDSAKGIDKSFSGTGKGLDSVKASALLLVGAFAGLKAIGSAIRFFKESIAEAAKEQDAIQRLNNALALTGKFSEASSKSIQDFANSLQNTTKFGNDTTLEVASLIQSLGKLDTEGLQRATKASLDLSTALGIDVNSAATLVSKAAAGNISAFSRYGIQMQVGATNAQTFANALNVLEKSFGGSSEAAAKTFTGSLMRLNNVFGDFQETIGNTVLNSPAVIKIINSIGDAFFSLGNKITDLTVGKDIFKPIILGAIDFAGSLTFLVQGTATLVTGVLTSIGMGIVGIMAELIAGVVGGASRIVNLFAPNSDLANSLRNFATDAGSTATQSFDIAGQALRDAFTLESNEETALFFQSLRDQIDSTTVAASGLKNNINPLGGENATVVTDAMALFKAEIAGVKDIVVDFGTNFSDVFKRGAPNVLQGFAGAAGNAFATFGKSIASGKASLAGFGKAFLAAIGNTAVQLGTSFILEGTAYLFSGNPELSAKGPGLIAGGAALATFGGVLSASGAGGASGAAAGAGATGNAENDPGIGGALPPAESQKPTTQVAINISGDVLDSRDTGLRIVDLIKEYTDRNGRTEVLA